MLQTALLLLAFAFGGLHDRQLHIRVLLLSHWVFSREVGFESTPHTNLIPQAGMYQALAEPTAREENHQGWPIVEAKERKAYVLQSW
jgi:hypothetical protein